MQVRHWISRRALKDASRGSADLRWARFSRNGPQTVKVFSARVRGGAIVPEDDVTLPEGATVTVIANDDSQSGQGGTAP